MASENNTAIPLTAEKLNALNNIRHGFFSRNGGQSKGIYESLNTGLGSNDAPDIIKQNRALCAAAIGVKPTNLITVYQHHSPEVITVSKPFETNTPPKADAIVTKTPNIAVAVLTADCGPVLLADEQAGVIAAAHAGWRGAIGGVLENTIEEMEALGANRAHITAVLGPTIAQQSYEIGADVIKILQDNVENAAPYLYKSAKTNHALFNLPRLITDKLKTTGIGTVDNLNLCTYENEEMFYSFRRTTHKGESDYGRMLSAITLAN